MVLIPGLSLRSNPWAEISERLRRIHQFQSAYSSISIGVLINFNRRIHQVQLAYSSNFKLMHYQIFGIQKFDSV